MANFRAFTSFLFLGCFWVLTGCSPASENRPSSDPEAWADAALQVLSPSEKAAQVLIVHFHSIKGKPETTKVLNPVMAGLLRELQPGGVLFFQDNFESLAQTQVLTSSLQSLASQTGAGIPLFLATDEEGGRVARLGRKPAMESPNLPSARKLGEGGEAAVLQAGTTLGAAMKRLGLNMNLGPIADLDTIPGNPLGDRAFSSNPKTAGALALAFLSGVQDQGVLAVVKHFPGLGMVVVDPHEGLPRWTWDRTRFDQVESVPFRNTLTAGGLMLAHLEIAGLEDRPTPAPWSPKLIQGLLRGEWGYQGLVMTDALNMGAVSGVTKPGEETVRALVAGADLVLMPPDPKAAQTAVLKALETGELKMDTLNRAVKRILLAKKRYAGLEMAVLKKGSQSALNKSQE